MLEVTRFRFKWPRKIDSVHSRKWLLCAAAGMVLFLVVAVVLALWRIVTPLSAETLQNNLARWSETHGHPAIVVGLIDNDRVSIFTIGSSGTRRPLDAESLFEIGSLTKTFTATILAEEILARRVHLNDPVQGYLPSSIRLPNYHGQPITMEDLATQTSGLPRLPTNMDTDAPDPYAHYGAEQLTAFVNEYRLTRPPGSSYEYSNLGVGILALALSVHAHQRYETLVSHAVLRPLNMHSTFVDVPRRLKGRLVVGHYENEGVAPVWHFRLFAGAGGLRSSLTDMLRYLAANMSKQSLNGACELAQPPLRQIPGAKIGLIWMIWRNWMIWHNGETAGFHSFIGLTPDRRRGIVILAARGDAPLEMLGSKYLSPF